MSGRTVFFFGVEPAEAFALGALAGFPAAPSLALALAWMRGEDARVGELAAGGICK